VGVADNEVTVNIKGGAANSYDSFKCI